MSFRFAAEVEIENLLGRLLHFGLLSTISLNCGLNCAVGNGAIGKRLTVGNMVVPCCAMSCEFRSEGRKYWA